MSISRVPLCINHSFYLADEPTGNLDGELSLGIFNLFEEFNRLGMTVLIATHDINLIQQKPKPCLVLEQGYLRY